MSAMDDGKLSEDPAEVRVVMPRITFSALVDPTPTPTNLVRLCEEQGIFSNLQPENNSTRASKNPFEESFRRASLHLETPPVLVPVSNDDQLDTPVAPEVHSWAKEPKQKKLIERRKLKRLGLSSPENSEGSFSQFPSASCSNQSDSHQWLLEANGNVANSEPTKSNNTEIIDSITSKDAFLVATKTFSPAPNFRYSTLRLPNGKTVPVVPNHDVMLISEANEDTSEELPHRGKVAKVTPRTTNSPDNEETILSRRERNRAAAIRSRERKKKLMDRREVEYQRIRDENAALRKENEELKQKLAALTGVLLNSGGLSSLNQGAAQGPLALLVPPAPPPPQIFILSGASASSSTSASSSSKNFPDPLSNLLILPKPTNG